PRTLPVVARSLRRHRRRQRHRPRHRQRRKRRRGGAGVTEEIGPSRDAQSARRARAGGGTPPGQPARRQRSTALARFCRAERRRLAGWLGGVPPPRTRDKRALIAIVAKLCPYPMSSATEIATLKRLAA